MYQDSNHLIGVSQMAVCPRIWDLLLSGLMVVTTTILLELLELNPFYILPDPQSTPQIIAG